MILFSILFTVTVIVVAVVDITTEWHSTTEFWMFSPCVKDEVKRKSPDAVRLVHWRTMELPWVLCIQKLKSGERTYGIHRIGECPHSLYKRKVMRGGGNING